MPDFSKGAFLDFGQAYRKAADYCALQDRCISEMKLKLKYWNIDKSLISQILNKLTEEGFLDEKRFAIHYTGGKFRINGWGKLKIAAGLRARSVQANWIQLALSGIDTEDYERLLETLLQKKIKQLGGNTPENQHKAAYFASSRGFEPGLIAAQLRDIEIPDL